MDPLFRTIEMRCGRKQSFLDWVFLASKSAMVIYQIYDSSICKIYLNNNRVGFHAGADRWGLSDGIVMLLEGGGLECHKYSVIWCYQLHWCSYMLDMNSCWYFLFSFLFFSFLFFLFFFFLWVKQSLLIIIIVLFLLNWRCGDRLEKVIKDVTHPPPSNG